MIPGTTPTPKDAGESTVELSPERKQYLSSALLVLALDGTIRAVNRAALKFLNLQSSEVIGQHFSHFLRITEPPLLTGGYARLVEMGGARMKVSVRIDKEHFVSLKLGMAVIYDEQAQRSGLLVMSSRGSSDNFFERQAVASVADRVSRLIVRTASTNEFWESIFEMYLRLFECPGGWLTIYGERRQIHIPFGVSELHGLFLNPDPQDSIHDCPCKRLTFLEEPCAVNVLGCPWLHPEPNALDTETISANHGVAPLFDGSGKRLADICLIPPAGRLLHRHELILMDAIADQIGQALERGEIDFPPSHAVTRLSPKGRTESSQELRVVLEQILVNLAAVVPFISAGVFLLEDQGMRLHAAVKYPGALDLRGRLFPLSANILHREIMRTQKRIVLDDAQSDERFQTWGGLDYIHSWMGLPLIVNDDVIGIITVDREEVGAFSEQEGALAQIFADQAAVAMEKAKLADELRTDKRNLELLYQLSKTLVAVMEPQAVAENALALLSSVFGGCYGEIYVLERGELYLQLLAAVGHRPDVVQKLPNQPYLRPGVGIVGASVELRRPVIVPDVSEDPRWVWVPDLNLVVRSIVSVPLIARNEVAGALVLGSPEVNTFTHDYLQLLQSIAGSVALALQNARLFVAERRRRQEAETLRNVTGAVTLDLRLEQILDILLERLRQVVRFDSASVMIVEGRRLQAVAGLGLPHPEEVIGRYFPIDNSLFAQIQRERRAIFFSDVKQMSRFSGWGGTSSTRGWMGVPLIHRGQVLGYITLDSLEVDCYGEKEATVAQAFANQAAITLVNAQLLRDSQSAAFEQHEVSAIFRGLNGATSLSDIQATVAPGVHRLFAPSAVEIALYLEEQRQVQAARSAWGPVDETDGANGPAGSNGPDGPDKAEGADKANRTVSSISSDREEIHESIVVYHFDDSAAVESLRQGKSYIATNMQFNAPRPVEKSWTSQGYRSQMALPLQSGAQVLGHIQLLWQEHTSPSQAIHFLLPQIVDGIALAVEKLKLLEQTIKRADELVVLSDLSSALRRAKGREQIIQVTMKTSMRVLQADLSYVLVPHPDEECLLLVSWEGEGPKGVSTRLGYHDSIAGQVFRTGQPYFSSNLLTDPRAYRPTVEQWKEEGVPFVSAIYAPLRAGDEMVGVISLVSSKTHRSFTQTDLNLCTAIAEIAGTALHRATVLENLEQRVLERTVDLAQANVQLRKLDQMKSDFVSNVSHELRTPLTNVRLYLDLLESGPAERRSQYLQVLHQEVDQLQGLIESVLEIATFDDTRQEPIRDFEVMQLTEIVQNVYEGLLSVAQNAGVHLEYTRPDLPCRVLGGPVWLAQMTTNLVRNAILYNRPEGRVTLNVACVGQEEVVLTVEDTGIGIGEEELDRIFERFYRSSRVTQSHRMGAGLGLPIVKEIVLAHNAHMHVESVVDKGTIFTIRFPAPDSA